MGTGELEGEGCKGTVGFEQGTSKDGGSHHGQEAGIPNKGFSLFIPKHVLVCV